MSTYRRSSVSPFLWIVLAALAVFAGPRIIAQSAVKPAEGPISAASRVKAQEIQSKLMGRKMPFNVILPRGYDAREENGRRYPVLYLLHGLTGNFTNWAERTKIQQYTEPLKMIIVTPEGENGWYTDAYSKDGAKYESYIIRELIPEVDKKFRTIARRDQRAIAGLSMGGFGALKFGLKYPELFKLAGSFSGALGVATITESKFPGTIGKSIDAIFGPEGSEVRKANDPFDIIRRATPDKIKAMPFIYVDCGTEDFLFQNNREFLELLVEKGVPHEYRQLPGAHDWKYWDKQVQEFLEIVDRTFGSSSTVAEWDSRFDHPIPEIRNERLSRPVKGLPTAGVQDQTVVHNAAAARMLLGRHLMSLQWISWDYFGQATVTNSRGIYRIKGEQKGRGTDDFLRIDGVIRSIDAKQFTFEGTIITQISHINGGEPCTRDGEFVFRITGSRKYWRLMDMDNPCDGVTDYVDIYFR